MSRGKRVRSSLCLYFVKSEISIEYKQDERDGGGGKVVAEQLVGVVEVAITVDVMVAVVVVNVVVVVLVVIVVVDVVAAVIVVMSS